MRSLERRLIVTVLTTVTAGFAIVGAIAVSMVSAAIQHEFDTRLRGVAEMLAASAEFTQAGDFVATRIPETAEFLRIGSGWYWMIATDERILSRSRSLRIEQLPLKPPVLWDAAVIEGPGGRRVRAFSIRYAAPRLPVAITITATGLQAVLDADIRGAVRRLIAALGAGAILTALATAIVVRRALRPLAETANAIPRIAEGHLPALRGTGYREIDALVSAVNELLSGARETVTRSRLAAANLAHALKTPLAALRSRAALIAPDDRELAADVDRLDRQIERHLGRVPHLLTAPMVAETVMLSQVLDDVRLVVGRSHAERPVRIVLTVSPTLSVAADREALEELFGALVDNAVKWATGLVEITAEAAGDAIRIVIADDGAGMSEAARLEAIQAGHRLDSSQPGTGLGLAIAADIVAGLGGTLRFGCSGTGGLSVEVRLRRRHTD